MLETKEKSQQFRQQVAAFDLYTKEELLQKTQEAIQKNLNSQQEILTGHYLQIEHYLQELMQQTKKVLTLPEAAKFLDFSEGYTYQLVSQGILSCYKPNGKKLYFNREELEKWVFSTKQQSQEEVRQSVEDYLVAGKRA